MAQRYDQRIQDESHQRLVEELRTSRTQGPGDRLMGATGGRSPEQKDGCAQGQQRGGHHDQQEVLDHVIPKEHVVVDAHEGFE